MIEARQGLSKLAHRGPDGHGEWVDRESGVYLGHQRLAVIGLDVASTQPIARGKSAVSYNGEIYNYKSVRGRLEGTGVPFTSRGDAEVLLAAWHKWGEASLGKLDGMFAFAMWTGEEAALVVDPFGEKPLYYAETSDGIYVSSELKPLVEVLGLEPSVSDSIFASFMGLGFIAAPATAYAEISRLPPASFVSIRNGRISRRKRYWTAPVGVPGRGSPAPLSRQQIGQVHQSLIENVELRLVADVPVTLFLSSGTDSSLVAAIAAKELDRDLSAITVSYPSNPTLDESPQAKRIADHLGISLQVIESGIANESITVDRLLDLFGQPSDNVTAFAVEQLANAIRGRYKVALTGLGGDEVTMGYGKYVEMYRLRHLLGASSFVRTLAAFPLNLLRISGVSKTSWSDLVVNPQETYVAMKNYPTIRWLRKVPGFLTWTAEAFSGDKPPFYINTHGRDLRSTIADEHNLMYDLASMRHGVELRSPFLSRNLVELVASFDPRALVGFGQKSVLRRLLGLYLPPQLVDGRKRGFSFPQSTLLNAFGDTPPQLQRMPQGVAATAWSNRSRHNSWANAALRLAVFAQFQKRYSESPQMVL